MWGCMSEKERETNGEPCTLHLFSGFSVDFRTDTYQISLRNIPLGQMGPFSMRDPEEERNVLLQHNSSSTHFPLCPLQKDQFQLCYPGPIFCRGRDIIMINAQHFSFLLYLVNTHDVSNLEGRWRDEVKLSFRGCPHPLAFTSTHTSGGNIQTTKPILSEDHSAHISLTVTHLLFVFYLPAR